MHGRDPSWKGRVGTRLEAVGSVEKRLNSDQSFWNAKREGTICDMVCRKFQSLFLQVVVWSWAVHRTSSHLTFSSAEWDKIHWIPVQYCYKYNKGRTYEVQRKTQSTAYLSLVKTRKPQSEGKRGRWKIFIEHLYYARRFACFLSVNDHATPLVLTLELQINNRKLAN